MKKIILAALSVCLLHSPLFCQPGDGEIRLLQKLDSTGRSPFIGKYFAELYFATTLQLAEDIQKENEYSKDFIRRMEAKFAEYFFQAADAFDKKRDIPPVWKAYFSDTTLSPLQYLLLGINAHVNGDIWKALVAEFTRQELEQNKKAFLRFNKGISVQYRRFYDGFLRSGPKTILLNNISFGLIRSYGRTLLVKWRKRQMNLALLYFSDREGFDGAYGKLQRKMDHINRLVLRNL